jgi:alpha-tubulin suppressor-like RCC1 family protein
MVSASYDRSHFLQMILLLSAWILIPAAGRRQLSDDSCTANAGYFCHYGARHCVAGMSHSVCVMTDDTVTTFGTANYGALGHGDYPLTVGVLSPKAVAGLERVRSCNVNAQCTVCTMNDSTMRGFGINNRGQLALGYDTGGQNRPMTALVEAVHSCSIGEGQTVCVMEDFRVRSCGSRDQGGLGDGQAPPYGATLNILTSIGSLVVRACSVGGRFTICVKEDSSVVSWGTGGNGRNGQAPTTAGFVYAPTAIAGLTGVRACSAGLGHVLCVMEDSTVVSWGYGDADGHEGTHRGTGSHVARVIDGLTGVRTCSAGDYHSGACCKKRA